MKNKNTFFTIIIKYNYKMYILYNNYKNIIIKILKVKKAI